MSLIYVILDETHILSSNELKGIFSEWLERLPAQEFAENPICWVTGERNEDACRTDDLRPQSGPA